MSETKVVLPKVMLALSGAGVTIFRCNTGMAWVGNGKPVKISKPGSYRLEAGDVVLRGGRPLWAGLVKGGSDTIGWLSRTITPDMVGQTIAQFVAIEVKDTNTRVTTEQNQFIGVVSAAGGLAGVARSPEDALNIIKQHSNSQ